MPRRLLPLLVAALVSVAGCTTVSPAAPPDAGARRAQTSGPAATPSGLPAPVRESRSGAALVRTGHGGPDRAARPPRDSASHDRPAPAGPPRATIPAAPRARAERPERRAPVRQRLPRPRPSAAARMRDLCRRADGMASPAIVRLCRDTFG
ncbi:hypothetical protein ACH4L5_12295 [Streptomyces sp. NPDC017405]|uniref:hypothetical protein n=1 Tax=unclassified Streptomyces TaxID=2593676 RepID=UPI0037943632